MDLYDRDTRRAVRSKFPEPLRFLVKQGGRQHSQRPAVAHYEYADVYGLTGFSDSIMSFGSCTERNRRSVCLPSTRVCPMLTRAAISEATIARSVRAPRLQWQNSALVRSPWPNPFCSSCPPRLEAAPYPAPLGPGLRRNDGARRLCGWAGRCYITFPKGNEHVRCQRHTS